MTSYTITVPGEMRGKQRPRAAVRGGHVRVYTPAETVSAENWIKLCAVEQGVKVPLDGPLCLSIAIQKAVPQSWSKKRRAAALAGLEMPTGRPDLDNCCKLACDSLNGIAWHDDAQIVEMRLRKGYAETSFTTLVVEAA